MKLTAAEVGADLGVATGGCAAFGNDACTFDGVSTDSRAEVRGKLFFALRGDSFDAQAFVPDVVARGAAGVVVHRAAFETLPAGDYARFGVDDTLAALQRVAQGSLRRQRPRVVAITGSNGKTTTKDLTVAALGSAARVHGTRGNLNNHIGVPLTVLARTGDEPYLVAEAGANDFGELDLLSRILEPDVVVITNIGRAHLEKFGSQDGVLRAKTELLVALRPDGAAVFCADDPYFPELVTRAGAARVLSFGFAPSAAVRIESARPLDAGRQELTVCGTTFILERPGRGNATNAAAALAVALHFGLDLQAAAGALSQCAFTGQRSAWSRRGGIDVLDDTYNANPDSMALAIEMLAARPGRRIAVLGDMLELGPEAAALHAQVGKQVAAARVEVFLGFGPAMAHAVEAARAAGVHATHYASADALVAAVQALVQPGDAVLVKGSRGSRMERVVQALAVGVA